ncbi:hypothetical protein [Aeromonas sobria]|nr:hypothetical protein [Aeromonas sobria]
MKKLISISILPTFGGILYAKNNIASKTLTDKDKESANKSLM